MTIAATTKLGRYEIRSQLGAGGMGEVYLAYDARLGRNVALKILPAEVATKQERMERFIREAKAAAGLSHPNIAHVYEIDEVDAYHFMATPPLRIRSQIGPGDTVRTTKNGSR